jgi:hypothetical protein
LGGGRFALLACLQAVEAGETKAEGMFSDEKEIEPRRTKHNQGCCVTADPLTSNNICVPLSSFTL